jgi:hypothetical protein
MTELALVVVFNFVAWLLLAIPGAAMFMLLMGALHANVSAAVPPIGFAAAYPIALFAGGCYQLLTVHTSRAAARK